MKQSRFGNIGVRMTSVGGWFLTIAAVRHRKTISSLASKGHGAQAGSGRDDDTGGRRWFCFTRRWDLEFRIAEDTWQAEFMLPM